MDHARRKPKQSVLVMKAVASHGVFVDTGVHDIQEKNILTCMVGAKKKKSLVKREIFIFENSHVTHLSVVQQNQEQLRCSTSKTWEPS